MPPPPAGITAAPPSPSPAPPYLRHPYPIPTRRTSSNSNPFASCCLATCFLALLAVAGTTACFVLFRPQEPTIAVDSVKFPAFSAGNGTASFTFLQHAAVRNPNRDRFDHYDSSLQLLSSSAGAVGMVYIPAGEIAGGRTEYFSATFDVRSMAVVGAAVMEMESRMKLVGKVKVLKVFSHRVVKTATCRVRIRVSDGSVLGRHC